MKFKYFFIFVLTVFLAVLVQIVFVNAYDQDTVNTAIGELLKTSGDDQGAPSGASPDPNGIVPSFETILIGNASKSEGVYLGSEDATSGIVSSETLALGVQTSGPIGTLVANMGHTGLFVDGATIGVLGNATGSTSYGIQITGDASTPSGLGISAKGGSTGISMQSNSTGWGAYFYGTNGGGSVGSATGTNGIGIYAVGNPGAFVYFSKQTEFGGSVEAISTTAPAYLKNVQVGTDASFNGGSASTKVGYYIDNPDPTRDMYEGSLNVLTSAVFSGSLDVSRVKDNGTGMTIGQGSIDINVFSNFFANVVSLTSSTKTHKASELRFTGLSDGSPAIIQPLSASKVIVGDSTTLLGAGDNIRVEGDLYVGQDITAQQIGYMQLKTGSGTSQASASCTSDYVLMSCSGSIGSGSSSDSIQVYADGNICKADGFSGQTVTAYAYCFNPKSGSAAGCTDGDGDGYSPDCGQNDCDDGDPSVYPGAPEDCSDGIDNDCDRDIDDDDSDCLGCPPAKPSYLNIVQPLSPARDSEISFSWADVSDDVDSYLVDIKYPDGTCVGTCSTGRQEETFLSKEYFDFEDGYTYNVSVYSLDQDCPAGEQQSTSSISSNFGINYSDTQMAAYDFELLFNSGGSFSWTDDSSGYENNGDPSDNVSYLRGGFPDENSYALVATGFDEGYIFVDDHNTISGYQELTAMAWVNLDNTVGTKTIVGKSASSSDEEWALKVSGDALYFRFFDEASGCGSRGVQTAQLAGAVLPGQWTHIAVTYNGSSSYVKFYVNGDYQQSFPVGSGRLCNKDVALRAGIFDGSGSVDYSGRIDEVKIYNDELSEGDICRLSAGYDGSDRSQLDPFDPLTGQCGITIPPVSICELHPELCKLGPGKTGTIDINFQNGHKWRDDSNTFWQWDVLEVDTTGASDYVTATDCWPAGGYCADELGTTAINQAYADILTDENSILNGWNGTDPDGRYTGDLSAAAAVFMVQMGEMNATDVAAMQSSVQEDVMAMMQEGNHIGSDGSWTTNQSSWEDGSVITSYGSFETAVNQALDTIYGASAGSYSAGRYSAGQL